MLSEAFSTSGSGWPLGVASPLECVVKIFVARSLALWLG